MEKSPQNAKMWKHGTSRPIKRILVPTWRGKQEAEESITLFDPCWWHQVGWPKYLTKLCVCTNDGRSVASVDFGVTNTLFWRGEFTNAYSTSNEDQLCFYCKARLGNHCALVKFKSLFCLRVLWPRTSYLISLNLSSLSIKCGTVRCDLIGL